jgi:hypothetical protein
VEGAGDSPYLGPEARARIEIDGMLGAAGWAVQDYSRANITAARGVAVREFPLRGEHGRADYLLFVEGAAAGVIEAKKRGATLTGVADIDRQMTAIDAIIREIRLLERRSRGLRRAILDRAVRGELVPQDPSDEPATALLARIRAGRAAKTPAPRRRGRPPSARRAKLSMRQRSLTHRQL